MSNFSHWKNLSVFQSLKHSFSIFFDVIQMKTLIMFFTSKSKSNSKSSSCNFVDIIMVFNRCRSGRVKKSEFSTKLSELKNLGPRLAGSVLPFGLRRDLRRKPEDVRLAHLLLAEFDLSSGRSKVRIEKKRFAISSTTVGSDKIDVARPRKTWPRADNKTPKIGKK